VKAVTDLIKAVAWPCLVLFLAFSYRADFISILNTREVKVGAAGIEIGAAVASIQATRDGVDQTLQRLADAPPQDQERIRTELRRNLNQDLSQLEQQLSVAAPSAPVLNNITPSERPADTQAPGATATDRERQGFRELAARNLDKAKSDFDDAFALFPTLHNVSEIRDLLRQNAAALKAGDDRAWRELYGQILKKYAWGMPPDVRKQFQTAANSI